MQDRGADPYNIPSQPHARWLPLVAIAAVLVSGVLGFFSFSRLLSANRNDALPTLSDGSATSDSSLELVAVTALGRIEPFGEVTRLSAPAAFRGGVPRVRELLVGEGDWVQTDQIVAILDENSSRQADLAFAREQVRLSQAELDKVREGAQEGEIEAQKATISRLEAELANAQTEYRRNQTLYEDGAISTSLLDEKRLLVDTLHEQISEANSTLARISEVRPIDVRIAEQEVESAIAAVQQAQASLELTYVRAPRDSQILKIHAHPGEIVGEAGVAEIGQTDRMLVVAEVYQTDIRNVSVGQSATITGDALNGELTGTVTQIGWQVDRQDIFSVNPGVDTDRRIVEVRIAIDDPSENQSIASLTNLQVEVAIQIDEEDTAT